MKATYVSVWDGEEIRTSCDFNPETKEVDDVETVEDDGSLEVLDEESIELPNGEIIKDFIFDGNQYINGEMVEE